MAVNGIEIAVGQKWKCRDGKVRTVAEYVLDDPSDNLPWLLDVGVWVTDAGCASTTGDANPFDLITYLKPVESPENEIQIDFIAPTSSAPSILEAAATHMRDRAATYDKPEGERSMSKTVEIFNAFHGANVTEAQGWHFMQILKDVRMFSNVQNPHQDSVEDAVAYAALKGESLLKWSSK